MAVTNHPLASAAGAEILAAGGNAIDAAVAALFTLTVVEPMMVGIFGGGMMHIRLADGHHVLLDGLSTAPLATSPDCYRPKSDDWPDYQETEGRANAVGPRSIAVPGNLLVWCEALAHYGTVDLETALGAAIRHAKTGFRVTPYLAACIAETSADLARDATIARLYLPDGLPLAAGETLVQADYGETLAAIATAGSGLLHGGALGHRVGDYLEQAGAFLTPGDLAAYRTIERPTVRGSYRGVEIVGPPPPSSGGALVLEMLNILEGFDMAGLGFGTPAGIHLILEAHKIAFADRAAAMADPAFLDVPVDRLMSKAYAAERRSEISAGRAGRFGAGASGQESANTTHLTVADAPGNIVAATHTINSLFGARMMVPGTGIVPNNYMYVFDPHPGLALSIAPGKRVTTSQAPLIALRDGRPWFALGLPGGVRIFGSAMQAVLNMVDHGMTLQEAVEAPRVWTQGQTVEIEASVPGAVRAALAAMGHDLALVPHVGGGMCAVGFEPDGLMTGAACWRADGAPVGLGGGLARQGARFWPDTLRG